MKLSLMKFGVVATVACIIACDDPPRKHNQVDGLNVKWDYGDTDVHIVHDDKRGVICYVTGGTGGGISCVRDPIHEDAGAKP